MRLPLTPEQVLSKKETCPRCGAVVGSAESVAKEETGTDTQMVNVSEMARMAQEGLDIAASGEWDTVRRRDRDRDRNR